MSSIGSNVQRNFLDASALRRAAERPAASAAGSVQAEDTGRQVETEKKAPEQASAQQPGEPKAEKEWTILLYLNGNNGLANQAISTVKQMEFVGSNDKIDFVAQVARPKGLLDRFSKDWNGVRRYHIEHNGEKFSAGEIIKDALTSFIPGQTKKIKSPVAQDLGTADMGSPKTLEDFLKWGMKTYPAKHYMVVMMGPSTGLSGMMKDELSGNQMKAPELGQALANVHQETGHKIDVLNIDGSATNTMELAYQIKDHVGYMVGSQGIQAGSGMPLAMMFNEMKNANEEQGQDALTMARFMTLMNSMAAASPQFSSTISAIDLGKVEGVKTAWDNLAKELLGANVSGDKIRQLLDATQDFQGRSKNQAYQNSRDAYHFAQLVLEDKTLDQPKLKAAAKAAMEAIEGSLVGDAAVGKYVQNAHGMSIFGPTHYGFFRPDGTPIEADFTRDAEYGKTAFAADTAWDEVLDKSAKDSGFNRAAKTIGLSETALDRIHANVAQHKGKVTTPLSFGSFIGWMNALNAWGGRPATGMLFLNPQQAVYAGVAGAGYDAAKALENMYYSATKLKDVDAVVNNAFEVATAGAKATANLSYLVPALAPFGATAGALMFFSPWIKNFYGIYEQYKSIKDNIELSTQPQVNKLALAAAMHVGGKQLWDE